MELAKCPRGQSACKGAQGRRDPVKQDGDGHLAESSIPTSAETKRYSLGSTLVATNGGGTLSYLHPNFLHSTVSSSSSVWATYAPYGLIAASAGTLPTDRQFQGQQDQTSVGLYRMGARWYDPTIGLWTQPDTLVPNPLDPLALNRYSFVEGNPLTRTDPTGHDAVTTCQNPSGCQNGNSQPSLTGNSSSNSQQPPNGVAACQVFFCVAIGNYAVWVFGCDETGCFEEIVPIPGAIPPPDVGGSSATSDEDLAGGSDTNQFARTSAYDASSQRGVQLELPGFEDVERNPATEGHHAIPVQILKGLSDAVRKAVQGKRGAPNVWDIPKYVHREIHNGAEGGAYNKAWRDALQVNREQTRQDPTAPDLLKIRDAIISDFDLDQYQP